MEEKRNWRDAKIPQWVKDSVQADLEAYEVTAALSWPTEPKPQPVFWGSGYGQVRGTPEEGTFWRQHGAWDPVQVSVMMGATRPIIDGSKESIRTGEMFFRSEHDARLYVLWDRCEQYAKELAKLRWRLR